MTTDDEVKVPVLYEYAYSTYQAMKEQSSTEMLRVGDETMEEGLVYEGFLTRLITVDLELSTPYYTHITRLLRDMECIVQLRRGGSTTPSRWLLLDVPTLDKFESATEIKERREERKEKIEETVSQRINDLVTRINNLEEKVDILWEELTRDLG